MEHREGPSRANHRKSPQKVGFDYVHVAVDDYTRLAYAEVLPDEKGPTCAGFLTRAAAVVAANGRRRLNVASRTSHAGLGQMSPWLQETGMPENDGGASVGHPDDRSVSKSDWGTS
ncbi:hypothetical protein ABID68_004159 [Pseudarthrobacter sp. PvP022]